MKARKWIIPLLILVGILFAVIGVPVIINECYKTGTGYFTLWHAEDVLSYYGNILAASVAIMTVWATIHFTRKQIEREFYLKTTLKEWNTIENMVAKVLDDINPSHPTLVGLQSGQLDPYKTYVEFSTYSIRCSLSLQHLLTYASAENLKSIEKLTGLIQKNINTYSAIAEKAENAFHKLGDYMERIKAEQTLDDAGDGGITYSQLQEASHVLNEIPEMDVNDIQKEIQSALHEMMSAQQDTYPEMLTLKNTVFNSIYSNIRAQANNILCFWRKK